jgi:hypothetical protein
MKPVPLVGSCFVLGALALTCQGITYTTREKRAARAHAG